MRCEDDILSSSQELCSACFFSETGSLLKIIVRVNFLLPWFVSIFVFPVQLISPQAFSSPVNPDKVCMAIFLCTNIIIYNIRYWLLRTTLYPDMTIPADMTFFLRQQISPPSSLSLSSLSLSTPSISIQVEFLAS